MSRELLLGCGNRREKMLGFPGKEAWEGLTTLDIDPRCNPDMCFDLKTMSIPGGKMDPLAGRLPISDNFFSEIHAYEVLEHCGDQGDHRSLFMQFSEFWRVLEPGGHLFATVPDYRSLWAWGDPSHQRIINRGTLTFLSQANYEQVGKTSMSDFRGIYRADFECVQDGAWGADENGRKEGYYFILRAVKPSRWKEST